MCRRFNDRRHGRIDHELRLCVSDLMRTDLIGAGGRGPHAKSKLHRTRIARWLLSGDECLALRGKLAHEVPILRLQSFLRRVVPNIADTIKEFLPGVQVHLVRTARPDRMSIGNNACIADCIRRSSREGSPDRFGLIAMSSHDEMSMVRADGTSPELIPASRDRLSEALCDDRTFAVAIPKRIELKQRLGTAIEGAKFHPGRLHPVRFAPRVNFPQRLQFRLADLC